MSVTVELVGLIPELYRLCPRGAGMCALEPDEAQLRDYPPEARADLAVLAEIYRRLLAEFGDRVRPVSVGLLSPRGLWLSLRHRLRQEPAVVVAGRRAIPAAAGYEAVREAVLSALV